MFFQPNYNLIEELKWRGLLHDSMPGTEDILNKEQVSGYVGFDPTADSLHIGNLVPVILLKHLQRAGHKPFVLVGGATGLVGDPSGKREERKLLDTEIINHNVHCQQKQLEKFLDFGNTQNSAVVVNNYDWFKDFTFLDFIRDVGKHISVNYMLSKDSVKNRLETGMSFTEFTYQLVQGYDFYHLFSKNGVKLQMGGSDQWGNITTGTELIRRICGGEAYALTAPLLTKSDGSKFGKSEGGNVWLDPKKTSPFKMYQFWLNISDDEAEKLISIFTFLSKSEIESLKLEHRTTPHLRLLQKTIGKEVTSMVHSPEEFEKAVKATEILFGKSSLEDLLSIDAYTLESAFDDNKKFEISVEELTSGINICDVLAVKTSIFPSKGEARRMVQGNAISIKKEKISDPSASLNHTHLIHNKYLFIQKGKDFFLVSAQ